MTMVFSRPAINTEQVVIINKTDDHVFRARNAQVWQGMHGHTCRKCPSALTPLHMTFPLTKWALNPSTTKAEHLCPKALCSLLRVSH